MKKNGSWFYWLLQCCVEVRFISFRPFFFVLFSPISFLFFGVLVFSDGSAIWVDWKKNSRAGQTLNQTLGQIGQPIWRKSPRNFNLPIDAKIERIAVFSITVLTNKLIYNTHIGQFEKYQCLKNSENGLF
jgi:hypothetical protein